MSNTTRTSMIRLLAALKVKPATREELAVISGFDERTVREWITMMHAARLVYVAEWREDTLGRFKTSAFQWGSLPDVPRPVAKTARQRVASMRERRKVGL